MKIHKDLTLERWSQLTLIEQLANIGSDIIRTIRWKQNGNTEYSKQAFFRALELIDLTIADKKNKGRLKEVVRAREALVDHFIYDNEYNTTDKQWYNYFFQFGYAVAMQKGR
jgi:hypothetical protein